MCVEIPDGSESDWLSVLKPYQTNSLVELLKSNTYEEVAATWLSSNGPEGIARFGGSGSGSPFFERFKTEFHKFVCGDDTYKKDRKELAEQGAMSHKLLVSAISSALGAQIGYAATFLAPAATLLLIQTGKIGVKAYCSQDTATVAPESEGKANFVE